MWQQFLWRLFQGAIVGLVVAGNIYFEVTPNPYLAVMAGGSLAFAGTMMLTDLLAWHAKRKARRVGEQQASEHRELIRRNGNRGRTGTGEW